MGRPARTACRPAVRHMNVGSATLRDASYPLRRALLLPHAAVAARDQNLPPALQVLPLLPRRRRPPRRPVLHSEKGCAAAGAGRLLRTNHQTRKTTWTVNPLFPPTCSKCCGRRSGSARSPCASSPRSKRRSLSTASAAHGFPPKTISRRRSGASAHGRTVC